MGFKRIGNRSDQYSSIIVREQGDESKLFSAVALMYLFAFITFRSKWSFENTAYIN